MDLRILEANATLQDVDLAIACVPMPNWNRYSSKNEVRSVARNVRRTGLIDIAEIHPAHSYWVSRKKKRLGFWGAWPQDETLGDSSQTHR